MLLLSFNHHRLCCRADEFHGLAVIELVLFSRCCSQRLRDWSWLELALPELSNLFC